MKKYIGVLVGIMVLSVPSFVLAQTSDTNICVDLKNGMFLRDRDTNTNGEVTKLQNFLREQGFLTVPTTGFYGNATVRAVRQFQAAYGIGQSGATGPKTREFINSILSSGCGTIQNEINLPIVVEYFSIDIKRGGENEIYASTNDIVKGETHTIIGKNVQTVEKEKDIYIVIGGRKIKTTPVYIQENYFTLEFAAPENLSSGTNTAYLITDTGKSKLKNIYITKEIGLNIKKKTERPILEYIETQMANGERNINTVYRGGKAYLRGFHFYSYGTVEKVFIGGKEVSRGRMDPSEIEFDIPKNFPLGKQKVTIPGALTSITVNILEALPQSQYIRIISPNGNEKFGQSQPISVEYVSEGVENKSISISLLDWKGFSDNGSVRSIFSVPVEKNGTAILFSDTNPTKEDRYQIQICVHDTFVNGVQVCDKSDGFFEITSTLNSN